jgi:hypothetical protein
MESPRLIQSVYCHSLFLERIPGEDGSPVFVNNEKIKDDAAGPRLP